MRTTPEECTTLGRIIAEKLNASTGPVALLLPLRGVSAMDKEGKPFYDPDADAALFDSLRRGIYCPPVELIELDLHLNDLAVAARMLALLGTSSDYVTTQQENKTNAVYPAR